MSQWQFKLFEYDIREELKTDNIDYVAGCDQKKFIIQMFGMDEFGKTVCIFVKGFNPFFYVKVPDDWTQSLVTQFVAFIKEQMGDYFGNSLIKSKLVRRKTLYGFDNNKLHNFVQLKFTSMGAFNKAKNLWYESVNSSGRYERRLRKPGLQFMENGFTELYEAKIPPLLRLFHIQKISPSGWVALKNGCYTENKKRLTTCDYEFTVYNYKHLEPVNDINKEKLVVPFKILSLDIEASSSHGDFPLARKDYLKLATNMVDYLIENKIEFCDIVLFKNLIKTALGYADCKKIDKIYLKKAISETELDDLLNKLHQFKPASKETFIELKEPEEDENSDLEECGEEVQIFKKPRITNYKNKDSNVLEIINDKTCLRSTRIIELAKCFGQHNPKRNYNWEGIFPEVEGDRVTFIGSTLRRNGEEKPYLRNIIVVNDCDPIENAEVECYKTEKEALLAWTSFIQRENPDIIIGYNIHGWDEGFMYDRSIELNCVNQFAKLSRMKDEICIKETWDPSTKKKRKALEETSIKIASGQYDLRHYHMSGRLQIDFLNLFRREEQLPSYKLDYVASHFIGDIVTDIQYNENMTILKTKNLTGLNVNDYIVIEEIGHATDMYENGKKLKVFKIEEGCIYLQGEIKPSENKIIRWCLGKDDVTPQDIFKLSNKGPDGRAIVGKYCLMDCDLVHHLMRKNDTLTGYDEMSNLCWVPKSYLVFRGQGIKLSSYVGQKCREKNTLMPVLDKVNDDDGYEGAIVLDPKCGLYLEDPVACVDYSSLYPSSIISENISHDTKVWTKEYDLEDNLLRETGEKDEDGNYLYANIPDLEYVEITYDTFTWKRPTPKAAAVKVKCGYKTCCFVQANNGEMGILPSILDELLGARKSTKKQMKNEKDPFMKNVYDKRQLAIKISANSLYGQSGAKTSDIYDKDVAAATTATGRKLLIYAKEVIETCYNNTTEDTSYGKVICNGEYIYGDTDSVFFTFNLKELDGTPIKGKKALEITIELAKRAGALATANLKNPHDLEYEKTFLPFCLLSKKRYVGILYEEDPDKGKRKSMGIVLKRRDNADIVKEVYGGVIDILMKDKSIIKAVGFIKESLQKVIDEQFPKQKLVITKSLRSFYKNPQQIAHNVLAERIGDRDPGNKPKPGDRIAYVFIKNENKKALQGEKIETPQFVEENNLSMDFSHYITNQIMKPLQQVLALCLEQLPEFIAKRGKTMRSWKEDIEKLRIKWPDKEKFNKKYEEFRCKEVKTIIFDPYLKMLK